MRILIIDNFDSFTFNLYQMVGKILVGRCEVFELDVKRNNEITVEKIKERRYDRLIISPGPGQASDPNYFGVCAQVLTDVGKTVPTLGVCLGMQGLAHYYGAKVIRRGEPVHGKTSQIKHDGQGVFKGLPQSLKVMRYHSLVVEPASVPDCLVVSATVSNGDGQDDIMGLRHKKYPLEGVQFHPESFATEGGRIIISNFLFNNSA